MDTPTTIAPIRRRRANDRHARELLLLSRAGLRAWDRLLWLGCRDGWGPEEAWRRVGKGYVCGLERSAALAERASRLRGVPDRLEFKTWDGRAVPSPDCSFSHVISYATIGPSSRPVELLREIQRLLVPGGGLSLLEASRWKGTSTATGLLATLAHAGFAGGECVDAGPGWLILHAQRAD